MTPRRPAPSMHRQVTARLVSACRPPTDYRLIPNPHDETIRTLPQYPKGPGCDRSPLPYRVPHPPADELDSNHAVTGSIDRSASLGQMSAADTSSASPPLALKCCIHLTILSAERGNGFFPSASDITTRCIQSSRGTSATRVSAPCNKSLGAGPLNLTNSGSSRSFFNFASSLPGRVPCRNSVLGVSRNSLPSGFPGAGSPVTFIVNRRI